MSRGPSPRLNAGYSLVEVSVASAVLVIVVALAGAALAYFLRGLSQAEAQNDLDIDVQNAMERIKRDMRLTSLDEMYFWPTGAGPYTAVSFPIARDDDGDGALELDGQGRIIWDQTVVYHVWTTQPHQLRMTVFDPRDNSLTPTQRVAQLHSVATRGNGSNTYNSACARTEVIFENLFRWTLTPRGSIYDGYAAVTSRDVNVSLGSVVLTPGPHAFQFRAIGKNPQNPFATGYRIGLDTLVVSPCGAEREAEDQLPVTAQSGATAARDYRAGGSWSGNHQLVFPATATGHFFTLTLSNDAWEVTNFRETGAQFDNTTVRFDTNLTPFDYVLQLDGLGWTWSAWDQTGDTNGGVTPDTMRGYAVRVLLRGTDMQDGGWIQYNGARCYANFRAGIAASEQLGIRAAYFGECADPETPTPDVKPGTQRQLTFSGSPSVTISGSFSAWSDAINMAISKEKSYLVTFWVDSGVAKGYAWRWDEQRGPYSTAPQSYLIPPSGVTNLAQVAADVWSTRGDVIATNALFAVQYLYTTYPTNGTYISRILDTHVDDPVYGQITWNKVTSGGADVLIKARSGDQPDLSDAPDWSSVAPMGTPGPLAIGAGRYVQFMAILTPDASYTITPRLRDVRLSWQGAEMLVDVGGTFTKGPNYGIWELTVDGRRLVSGVNIALEIFKTARGYRGIVTNTSALVSEVYPRNTGR